MDRVDTRIGHYRRLDSRRSAAGPRRRISSEYDTAAVPRLGILYLVPLALAVSDVLCRTVSWGLSVRRFHCSSGVSACCRIYAPVHRKPHSISSLFGTTSGPHICSGSRDHCNVFGGCLSYITCRHRTGQCTRSEGCDGRNGGKWPSF